MNLRILCFVFIVFSFTGIPHSIAQGWQWAKSAGGTNNESAAAITTNAAGNVYVTGSFASPSVTLGFFLLNNTNNTTTDVYLAKYDPNGNVLWARSFGGSSDDYVTSITTDAWGYVYVTGFFYSTSITVGSTVLNNDSTLSATCDMYIVKYDSSGNFVWARKAGGTMNDRINAIKTDVLGNVIVTGSFESQYLIFGTDTVKNPLTTTDAVFVIKYDSAGNFIWATGTGPDGYDYGYALATDAANNIFVAGSFNSSSINFGNSVVLSNSSSGTADMFLVKYNAAGTAQWAQRASGANDDEATALSTDVHGNIYLAGKSASAALIISATTLTNATGAYNMFAAKYNNAGHLVWANSINTGTTSSYTYSLSVDDSSNLIVAGNFMKSSIGFGSSTITNDSAGTYSLFIAKYDSTGNALWANTTGGPASHANGVAIDQSGNIYLAGDFSDSSFYFGTNQLSNTINTGTSDMFIARYTQTATLVLNTGLPEQHITLYPNPADAIINVVLNGEGYSNIGVYDCLGRTVYQSQLTGNEKMMMMSTTDLKDGIYFLRAVRNGHAESATFVIRK